MPVREEQPVILVIGGTASAYPALLPGMPDAAQIFHFHPAASLAERCRSLHPHLAVLDLAGDPAALPLLEILSPLPAAQAPSAIVIGDALTGPIRQQALAQGAVAVIERPADRMELALHLSAQLRLHQELRRLASHGQELEQTLSDRNQRLQDALALLEKAERKLARHPAPDQNNTHTQLEILANATHELRTPLNTIVGFSELLRSQAHGTLGDVRYGEYADDIHDAACHLLALVEGTLDLARAETGHEALDIRDIDIGRTVQDSTRLVRQLAEKAGIHLEVLLPETPLHIRTDPDKVRQIVLNLTSNAIKFTPPGGVVTVAVDSSADGGAVILVIRDTGFGMAAQDIQVAMRPFGQVKQAERPHPKGTGLGLPLTNRFVQMLGGVLDIDSQPGKGTTVTVRLPPIPPIGD